MDIGSKIVSLLATALAEATPSDSLCLGIGRYSHPLILIQNTLICLTQSVGRRILKTIATLRIHEKDCMGKFPTCIKIYILASIIVTFISPIAQAQSRTSSIIVHVHNPEGVENASIEGMPNPYYSVYIFDGDIAIGYGAYNAETHNKPIADLYEGTHTIKAVFNGMTKEETVTLGPNETKTVTFVFDRTEIDVRPLMTTSGSAAGSASGSATSTWEGSVSLNDGEGLGECSFVNDGAGMIYWTLSSNYNWTQTPDKFTCNGSASITFNPSSATINFITGCMWFKGIDVSSVFTGGLGFNSWYVQQVFSYQYPPHYYDQLSSTNIASVYLQSAAGEKSIPLTPGSSYSGTWYPQDYYLKTVEQKAWNLLGTTAGGYYYFWDRADNSVVFNGFTFNIIADGLKVSSVPYDLTGTGVGGPGNQPPVASFTYSPSMPDVNEAVNFDASSSYDPDGTIVKYIWDFGDGTGSVDVTTAHVYKEMKNYNVTLTVTDNNGATGSTQQNLVLMPTMEVLNGVDFTAGPEISSDPERLLSPPDPAYPPIQGIVADGVARLLFRVNVAGPSRVTFSMDGGTGDPEEDGVFRPINRDDHQEGVSITVDTVTTSNGEKAFAIYQVPARFVRASQRDSDEAKAERPIGVKATVEPNNHSGRAILSGQGKILRPPIVLIHGIWATSDDTWMAIRNNLKIQFPGIKIVNADYSRYNASAFTVNENVLHTYLVALKDERRKAGIVMTQADVIAHSMGGVLSRICAAGPAYSSGVEPYIRDKNFRKGDIHKLITIDTPHFGSFLADTAIDCLDNPDPYIHPVPKAALLALFASLGKPLDKGAVRDLATTSDSIKKIKSLPLKYLSCHAIVGSYQVPGGLIYRIEDPDTRNLYIFLEDVERCNMDPYIIQNASDLVVSTTSQEAGLSGGAESTFSHWHTGIGTDYVIKQCIRLLNADINDFFFSKGYPEE